MAKDENVAETSSKQESIDKRQCRSMSPRQTQSAILSPWLENPKLISTEKEEDNSLQDDVDVTEKVPSVDEQNVQPENDIYPHGFVLITLTIALMASTFMVALDTNVIGTCICLYRVLHA